MLVDAGARQTAGERNRMAALTFPTWAESAGRLWKFLGKVIEESD